MDKEHSLKLISERKIRKIDLWEQIRKPQFSLKQKTSQEIGHLINLLLAHIKSRSQCIAMSTGTSELGTYTAQVKCNIGIEGV